MPNSVSKKLSVLFFVASAANLNSLKAWSACRDQNYAGTSVKKVEQEYGCKCQADNNRVVRGLPTQFEGWSNLGAAECMAWVGCTWSRIGSEKPNLCGAAQAKAFPGARCSEECEIKDDIQEKFTEKTDTAPARCSLVWNVVCEEKK